jgi:alanine racemase
MHRRGAIEVDTQAVTSNAGMLVDLAGGSLLCAVVKADGYGHGAVRIAGAALAGGASWLAVALVEEGEELRRAGIETPVLLLSEPLTESMASAHALGLTPTVYSEEGIAAASAAARGSDPWAVHLKVDTGMHRVGADPGDAVRLASLVDQDPRLRLGGTFTHLAVADEPARPETARQLQEFTRVLGAIESAGIDPGIRHAANSAGLLFHAASRLDMVRVGIALYGISPSASLEMPFELQPAMRVRSVVSMVRRVAAGEGVSYGLRHVFDRDASLAVVPLGYADGVFRALSLNGGEVLIGGVRRPIRGVVTMDQFVVEVTDGPPVRVGDEVVVLGRQGEESITAHEVAARAGTIPYEVVARFGPRLPRLEPDGPAAASVAS